VGVVPPQHMYGFETTVLMPLHAPVSSFAGATFYPEDICRALTVVPAPRVLVTTPRQIRALLASGLPLPEIEAVVSATAPLGHELAHAAENAWGTVVLEIFGATEAGSIASRRTIEGELWRLYGSVVLQPADAENVVAKVMHLPSPVPLTDGIDLKGDGRVAFLGRKADIIKLAGKRASLAGLNALLADVEGVEDGTFFDPGDLDSNPRARLVAFVVAPERTPEEIVAALRERIEAPFLPRRIVKVPSLPRNELGKIPRTALEALHASALSGPG
jgi:acyl-coenzyme A synthetase/AMP-(fatty) acid ligase